MLTFEMEYIKALNLTNSCGMFAPNPRKHGAAFPFHFSGDSRASKLGAGSWASQEGYNEAEVEVSAFYQA